MESIRSSGEAARTQIVPARPTEPDGFLPARAHASTSRRLRSLPTKGARRRAGADAVVAGLDGLARRLKGAVEPVQQVAQATQDAGKAVAATAERAAHAPPEIAREVRKELQAMTSGLGRFVALGAALAVAVLFALALLSAAAVEALDGALGEPFGALLVGLAYAVAAGLFVAALRRAKEAMKAEREKHARHRKEEVRHVVEPVTDAAREGGTSGTPRGTSREPYGM